MDKHKHKWKYQTLFYDKEKAKFYKIYVCECGEEKHVPQ
jgi:hypothetical protein